MVFGGNFISTDRLDCLVLCGARQETILIESVDTRYAFHALPTPNDATCPRIAQTREQVYLVLNVVTGIARLLMAML